MTAMRPSVDHTLLSPSGRASKRARVAALKRETARLFPPGYWDQPEPSENDRNYMSLRNAAINLRILANRGLSPRKHRKEAARLDAEADNLIRSIEA